IRGLSRLKRMGVRIVWTVHDLYDPEARWRAMDRWLVRFVYGIADAVIVHSRAARDQVAAEFDLDDCGKMHVVPHANYLGCYPDTISREAARRSFGLAADETAFVFFGAIRRYKGVLELIDAFRRIEGPKARLIVAGRAWEAALRREVEAAAAADPRIVAALRFVADDEVQRFLKAADIVVLPYKEYLTSGAIALAMSFGRACLVPNAGSMREVVDPRGAVFFDPGEPDSLVRALEESLVRRDELEEMGQRNFKEISAWTWARMARQTAEVYAAAFDGKKHKGDSQP
ncbi:MAG: glycosyltransferase, partial [Verrucomicrobia bacterium]